MSALLLDKQRADDDQDVQNRIAFGDERDFERHLETALPLVRPLVRHLKRSLPRNFEADELENIAVTALLAAVRDYCAAQDGDFVSYTVTRIRGAILDELPRTDWAPNAPKPDTPA